MADDYRVGYRKPPKETQFRKGQSGNPLGRPPKPKVRMNAENVWNQFVVVGTRRMTLRRLEVKKAVFGILKQELDDIERFLDLRKIDKPRAVMKIESFKITTAKGRW